MPRLRGRDVRAIAFVSLSSVLILAASFLLTRSVIISSALTAAWLAFTLTRPRMRRVIRRLRGETDGWSGYYLD